MTDKTLRYKNIWLILGLAMIAFVVYETLTSSPIKPGFKVSDKILHIVGYFGMMAWFIQIFQLRKQQAVLAAAFICMGVMLEFIQGWSGVRQYEIADMLANTTGVIIAWTLAITRFSNILFAVESFIFNQDLTHSK
jgi:VanZ family protein